MDDLQLNITTKKKKNNLKGQPVHKNAAEYKFVAKPNYSGKIVARKRAQNGIPRNFAEKYGEEPTRKLVKTSESPLKKSDDLQSSLRDLSENKGKFHGKNYQEVTDEMVIKQKQRSGGWISSLFKNNPDVPRMGQRAVKPLIEKVFTGTTFGDLNLHPHSISNLKQNMNLTELMTVQQKAIPIILQGRDVLIRSQTGSGKTLAYALPVIEGLQAIRPKINRHDGIRVVVVVPTRELAVQTYELFDKLVKPFIWIVPGLLSGGQKRKAEKARLRKGLNVLVGTPGRINDHLRHTHSLNFAKIGCLILDEADRLLDMGYEKDVAAIVKAIDDHKKAATYDPMALMKQTIIKVPENEDTQIKEAEKDEPCNQHPLTDVFLSKERQTILLSATLTKAVENLAGITMKEPVFVDTSDGKGLVADSLKLNKKDDSKDNPKDNKKDNAKEISTEVSVTKNTSTPPTVEDVPTKVDETKVNMKTGIKAFSGANHPDIFGVAKNKSENEINDDKNDSDSDSDYEYFKVQKEVSVNNEKNDTSKSKEKNEENEKTQEEQTNMFENALKTAIVEDELILPATVNQTFLVVPMKLRLVSLCSLIVEHCILNRKGGKMIIFMATLEMVDYHSELIETVLTGKDLKKRKQKKIKNNLKAKKKKGDDNKEDKESSDDSDSDYAMDYEIPAEGGLVPMDVDVFSLHGSMPHEQRMEVFKQFRTARRGVLFCTDVAARGIDVPRVDLVLQYCAPASATDYVHRVGRTGRAAQVGAAIMFLLPSEAEFVRHLEQKRIRLRQSDESKVLEALRSVAPSAATIQRAAIAVQAKLESTAHSSKDWLARASRAYTSWVRFYSGYPREVRPWLDARQLHLGHAAKSFALRETPAALAKRSKSDPNLKREKPVNRLTVKEEEEKKRPGFPKMKPGAFGNRIVNKQSSMHTASEFDSGLPPVDTFTKKKRNK